MCGCNGKYTLPSHIDLDKANEEIGYEVYDDSDVSDRRVKIAINKITKALEQYSSLLEDGEYENENGDVSVGRTDKFAWYKANGRNTVVYF